MNWIWMLAGLLVLTGVLVYVMGRPDNPGRRDDAQAWEHRRNTMTLRAERLQVRKTREPLASVTTRTEVSRELKTVTVPVTREDLVVERDGVEAARIPLREERVDVATRVVPLNEVSVYHREWEENEQIEAVLKKEVARIETTGDAPYVEETHDPGAGLT